MELQGFVAQAEKACKEGIAATKFGAGYYAGPAAGVVDPQVFWPRKPYKSLGKERQQWVIDVMGRLVSLEKSLPDITTAPSRQSNGVNGH